MMQVDKNSLQGIEIWMWRKMTNWMDRKLNEKILEEI